MTHQESLLSESFMNFDTHKSFKSIVAAGFSETQAEAIVDLVQTSKEYDISKLLTKENFRLFEQKVENRFILLENRIDNLESAINTKIDNLESAINNKIDAKISMLETAIFKQDSKQKIHLMSTLLTIIGIGIAIMIRIG